MRKIFAYFEKKKFVKFINAFFFVKKESSGKNLDIILFAYSRRARKSLQWTKGYMSYMAIVYATLKLSYVIDFSSQISSLYMVKEGKIYPVIDAPVHSKHDGASYNSVWKLHLFCKSL